MLLVNLGAEPFVVQPGDRIAQLVIAPVVIAELEEARRLWRDTVRGDGGFGHTGSDRVRRSARLGHSSLALCRGRI